MASLAKSGEDETKGVRRKAKFWNAVSSIYNTVTFSFINPLLKKGAANELDENSAVDSNPLNETIEDLTTEFYRIYNRQEKETNNSEKTHLMNPVMRTLIKQHAYLLLRHFMLTIGLLIGRLIGPLSLRWFLIWLSDYKEGNAERYKGWLWGLLLIASPIFMSLFNHHTFWAGYKLVWKTRMSMVAAVHAKLLTLNTSSVAKITTGHVVNLASNDAHRLSEAFPYWTFLVAGPLETTLILILLSFVLGFLPAIAGLSCVLILIPLQSMLSKRIAKLRRKTARITDRRINFLSEIISGSLAVKMLGWEDPLLKEVDGIRKQEHWFLKNINHIKGNSLAMTGYIQTIMACVTFIVYRFTENDFNVPDVLFAISLFNLPRLFMAVFFTLAVQNLSELLVSTRRLSDFFRLPEVSDNIDMENKNLPKGEVIVQNGNYGWYSTNGDDAKKTKSTKILERISKKVKRGRRDKRQSEVPQLIPTLKSISLHVKPGELVGISGKVGCGKSSLLFAFLNDMENLNPDHRVQMTGSVSYCAQVPWIMAATVRDNIMFGNDFDENLYNRVISSCALDTDIQKFPFGDQTEIGERGINLSGGQKARIALARAAYCKADINLLDDPLSAVDPNVGRILFERCISGVDGLMKNSTRLLVTHQKQFLPDCNRIILMNNGEIECIGTWNELASHHLLKDVDRINSSNENSVKHESNAEPKDEQITRPQSSTGTRNHPVSGIEPSEGSQNVENNKRQGQLVEKEDKVYGKVSLRVYWDYIVHIGAIPMFFAILALLINKMLYFGTEWWIADWAATDEEDQREHKWIWVLTGLTLGTIVAVILGMFALFSLLINGSTNLHKQMAKRVIHAPLVFFHRNPTGRILNRFSKDTGVQDDELSYTVGDVLLFTLHVLGIMVIVSIALPYMIPILAVIIYLFGRLRRHYVVTSREIRRYDATTRSPVYAMLSSNIKALPTIHAFQKKEDFQKKFLRALDLNGSWWMAFLSASRWVAFRMDCFVAAACVLSVTLTVALVDQVSEEVIGLALVYIVASFGTLQWWMRQTAELENQMTSVERNLEYTRLDQEPPRASDGGGIAPPNWPVNGTIEYSLVTASYRPDLEPVLKQLQFVIPGGSSVGIVGRTGSGKSSLLLSLFRLININEGCISIDGVDTSTIGIDVLRKQLAIIPQDPVLFGGTFRSNLDPWNEFSDAQIWTTLGRVHLYDTVKAFGGLNAPVAECGNNLSVGQRQLLCLARALLADSKILALDEATANVDRTTDAMIQDALHTMIVRNEKTLLIIAHRINTVLDCDLLLVLDGGKVVEFGTPTSLLSNANGVFKKMANAAKGVNDDKGRD
eukprot:g1012.t1